MVSQPPSKPMPTTGMPDRADPDMQQGGKDDQTAKAGIKSPWLGKNPLNPGK